MTNEEKTLHTAGTHDNYLPQSKASSDRSPSTAIVGEFRGPVGGGDVQLQSLHVTVASTEAPDPTEPAFPTEQRSPSEILINRELRKARERHPSKHDGQLNADLIRQFRNEIFDARRALDTEALETAYIKIAAMAIRGLEDVIGIPRAFEEEDVFSLTPAGEALFG